MYGANLERLKTDGTKCGFHGASHRETMTGDSLCTGDWW